MRAAVLTGCVALLCSAATVTAAADTASQGAAQSKPNLLLLFPDQWRWDWDGTYSDPTGPIPLNVPFLDSFRESGTHFTTAFVPAPVCAPSRSALAAGKEYDEAGVPCNFCGVDYPTNQTTFYKALRDTGGYHTMTTGKDDLTKQSQPGPDGMFHQEALGFSDGLRCSGKMDVMTGGPHEPYGIMLNSTTVSLPNGQPISAWTAHTACLKQKNKQYCTNTSYPDHLYEDTWVTANAITLLERKPAGKPWFMQVNFPGPHSPFTVTAPMHESVVGRKWPKPTDNRHPKGCGDSGAGDPASGGRCNYAAEVEHLDGLFKQIVDKVDAMGELDNTLVCISSDHGEMLGDHSDNGKTMPWSGSAQVPLLCSAPKLGVRQGATIDTPTATMDLAGTFLDFAGVPTVAGMTTQSLKPLLTGEPGAQPRPYIASGLQAKPFTLPGQSASSADGTATVTADFGTTDVYANGVDPDNGGYNWRMVVKQYNATTVFKYVCCKGACPGAPTPTPKPKNGYSKLLFNIVADRFDMHDVAGANPDVVAELEKLLPANPSFTCGASVVGDDRLD